MMRLLKNKKAVSPVVGVILMVAITIVLAATIYIWISSMSNPAAAAPSINLRGTWTDDATSGKDLVLTVVSVQGDARWEDFQIKVNGNDVTSEIVGSDKQVSGAVQAGQQITIKDFANDQGFSSETEVTVQIVHVPSNSVIYEDTFIVP